MLRCNLQPQVVSSYLNASESGAVTPMDINRSRNILFCQYHPDRDQAESAVPLLKQVDGVKGAERTAPLAVQLNYDLSKVSLKMVEDAMVEAGFHLDNSLMSKLKRALYHYTEENQRSALGCVEGQSNCVQKVFVNRYARLEHGCRDERPDHWRQYL